MDTINTNQNIQQPAAQQPSVPPEETTPPPAATTPSQTIQPTPPSTPVSPPPTTPPSPTPTPQQPPPHHGMNKTLLIIVAVGVVLALLGTASYALLQGKNGQSYFLPFFNKKAVKNVRRPLPTYAPSPTSIPQLSNEDELNTLDTGDPESNLQDLQNDADQL